MSIENKVGKLRKLIEDNGFDHFVKVIMPGLLEVKEGKSIMKPEDFSLKELNEAVDVTQFPIIVGTLISAKIMQAYDDVPKILDKLTSPFNSNKQLDRIPQQPLDTLSPIHRAGQEMRTATNEVYLTQTVSGAVEQGGWPGAEIRSAPGEDARRRCACHCSWCSAAVDALEACAAE